MTDRRRVLQVGGLTATGIVVLPACGSGPAGPGTEQEESAPPAQPDAQQSEELALIAAYDAALAGAGPARRTLYERIRDEHAAHLRALGWSAAPSASPSQADPPTRRALRRAERAAARRHTRAAVQDPDPERAQILALIAASEAQHIVALGPR